MSEGLKSPNARERSPAVDALDNSQALKSPDARERGRAVRALGNSQDHAAAVRTLEAVLRDDPDRDVRVFAAIALSQLGGSDTIALLVEKVASTDEAYVRGGALNAIVMSRDPNAIPGLISLFRRGAQIEARHALLKVGAPALPQLLQALNDSSPKVRAAVVDVLGEMGNPEVADRIAALQADPDPAVRHAVEGALVKLKATKH